jgi:sugar lactone lactonase YvrE
MLSRITCSNGLAFSPDGETLYHTDSPSRVVYAWTLHPATGALSHRREFARLEAGDGYCDGATVDAEGGYWMALVFGSKIRRYLPDGSLDLEIKLPFANPTNVAFGGVGYATLFVTTTQMSLGPGAVDSGMLGNVYSLECGFHGMPEPRFEG